MPRDVKPGSPPVSERVEIIADMMRKLEWDRGKSWTILAERWGVAKATVEQAAGEASRRVLSEVMDPQSVRLDAGVALSSLIRKCFTEDKDPNTLIRACALIATIAGANAPVRTENLNIEANAVTPAEAKRVMIELFGKETTPDAVDGDVPEDAEDSGEESPDE